MRSSHWTGFGFSVGLTDNLWSCECSFLRRFTGWIQSTAVEVIDQVSAIFFPPSWFWVISFSIILISLAFRSHHFNFHLFFPFMLFYSKNSNFQYLYKHNFILNPLFFCSRRTKKNDLSVLHKIVYYWFPLWMETKKTSRNITWMIIYICKGKKWKISFLLYKFRDV